MLDDLDSEPHTLEELMRAQGGCISEYSKFVNSAQFQQRSMHWTLSDFLCSKYVHEQGDIMKAAVKVSRLTSSLCHPQYHDHPFIILNKKLFGLGGYRQPDAAMCAFFCTQKENMDREVQPGQASTLNLQTAVEYLKRSFKENQPLLQKILESLPASVTKKELQKVKLNALDIVVKEEDFGLPSTMTKTACAEFFAQ
jgi:hypothetical protein